MKIRVMGPALLCALPYLLSACATAGKSATAVPIAATVDPQAQARRAQYDKDFDRFYYLEQQGFKEVDCRIDSPTTDMMMQSARGVLAPMAGKVDITDTLSEYRLTYSVEGGLKIDDPTADIVFKPDAKAVDPAKAEQGRAQFKNGFSMMIAGVDSEIRTVFEVITESDRNDVDVLYVTDTPDGFDTGYVDKKSSIRGAFSLAGDTGTVKLSPPIGGSMTAIEHFTPMAGNKLLLQDIEADVTQSGSKVHSTSSVVYQDLGQAKFPQKISVKGSMDTMQAAHMDVAFDIVLNDCSMK